MSMLRLPDFYVGKLVIIDLYSYDIYQADEDMGIGEINKDYAFAHIVKGCLSLVQANKGLTVIVKLISNGRLLYGHLPKQHKTLPHTPIGVPVPVILTKMVSSTSIEDCYNYYMRPGESAHEKRLRRRLSRLT